MAEQREAVNLFSNTPERAERGFLLRMPDFSRDGFDIDTGRVSMSGVRASFGVWAGDELRGLPNLDEGAEGDEDLQALKTVHTQSIETFAQMADTLRQLGTDRSEGMDNDARLRTAARVLEPKLARLRWTAEREIARAEVAIASEQGEIERATRAADAGEAVTHGEIRAHWKAMPDSERTGHLLAPKLAQLDADTLRALASAPAYMTGLTEQQHAKVREEAARRVAPAKLARLQRLRAGRALASTAIETLERRALRLVDFNRARQLEEAEAAARAKRAERYGVTE